MYWSYFVPVYTLFVNPLSNRRADRLCNNTLPFSFDDILLMLIWNKGSHHFSLNKPVTRCCVSLHEAVEEKKTLGDGGFWLTLVTLEVWERNIFLGASFPDKAPSCWVYLSIVMYIFDSFDTLVFTDAFSSDSWNLNSRVMSLLQTGTVFIYLLFRFKCVYSCTQLYWVPVRLLQRFQ